MVNNALTPGNGALALLEFLPGINSVTNALTLYSYNGPGSYFHIFSH